MDIGNKLNPLVEDYKDQISKEQREAFISAVDSTNVYHNVLHYEEHINPFFYDKAGLFWKWNKESCCYEMVDEIDLINNLENNMEIKGKTIASNLKSKYLESFKRIGRESIPEVPPKHWIQFKKNVFNLKTKVLFEATPKYFFSNSIPWDIGKSNKTPRMDVIFSEWVGEENVKTLYEIISYCCLQDYPIHLLFCLIGSGRNGKSRFLALLKKFIGGESCCSSELDLLMDSRFESAKLFKKLVCFMGETNFGVMEKTSLLKKLVGQDSIGAEFKGKQPFDFENTAKLCVSSNSLPSSTDTSEGFYRRWMIIDFPNNFPEGKDILETIPQAEYNNLAFKVLEILPVLIDKGMFSSQGSIEDRRKKFILASNPLPIFIDKFCHRDNPELAVKYSEVYLAYLKYLLINKKRVVSRKEFKKALDQEGFDVEKKQIEYESGYYIQGLKLKDDWENMIVTKVTNVTRFPLTPPSILKLSENVVTNVTSVTKEDLFIKDIKKSDRIFQKCSFCELNNPQGNFQLVDGRPICELCLGNKDVLDELKEGIINEAETKKM